MGQSGLKFRDADAKEGAIEIPEFLDDSPNEILAYVRETRYTDATDLWAKAKLEVIGLLHLVRFLYTIFIMNPICRVMDTSCLAFILPFFSSFFSMNHQPITT